MGRIIGGDWRWEERERARLGRFHVERLAALRAQAANAEDPQLERATRILARFDELWNGGMTQRHAREKAEREEFHRTVSGHGDYHLAPCSTD